MSTYLPWWGTAISLGLITIGFYLAVRQTLGVSGSWARIVMGKKENVASEAEAFFRSNPDMFSDALMTATIEQFGREQVLKHMKSKSHLSLDQRNMSNKKTFMPGVPWTAHLLFLVMLAMGGLIGALVKHDFSIRFNMGDLYISLFGAGISSPMMLFFGGIMVGFGTQMAGGCTSGHGLSGVSRFSTASIIATMVFFSSAIVFSILAHYLGSK